VTRLRVAVIGGGRNSEHDVSLASAASVAGALDPSRYVAVPFTIDRAGGWQDATGRALSFSEAIDLLQQTDVVMPLVHGKHGEDGALAALCELAGVPYVGSGVGAGAIGMDKSVTKLLAGAAGIPTAAGVVVDRTNAHAYRFRGPVVVKPVSGGSSVGVTLVTSADALPAAVDAALAEGDRVLIEERLVGREIDLAVLRRSDGSLIVSPPLEIDVDGPFDHEAKYGGSAPFLVPAALGADERWELETAAMRMYDALDCAGVARIDFFLTTTGLVLNEVNTTPGLTARSQVPRMFDAGGIRYPELLDLLITDALASRPRIAQHARG
jgi:D-alanine-D-alanine ligase